MIDNLDGLHSIIDDSSFPDVTKKRLRELIALELSGRSQKDFRDYIAREVEAEDNGAAR